MNEDERNWRRANPDKAAAIQQRQIKKDPFAYKIYLYRSRAKKLKVPFDLTAVHLKEIWIGICPVFKTPIEIFGKANKRGVRAALDRTVPSKGYTIGNVEWMSVTANTMKQDGTFDQLIQLGEWAKTKKDNYC